MPPEAGMPTLPAQAPVDPAESGTRSSPPHEAPSPGRTQMPDVEEMAKAHASPEALAPARVRWGGGDPERGRGVYVRHCMVCHGADGAGDGPTAPSLNPKPRSFRSGVYYLDADADGVTGEDIDLARVIIHGSATFGGSSAMPAWGPALSTGQTRDVVAFLRALETRSGQTHEPPEPSRP